MSNAMFRGDLEYVVESLLTGVDIDTSDEEGVTLLHEAIIFGQNEIAIALIEMGANINQPDSFGRTAFYWALKNRNEEMTEYLMARDAALDANADWSKRFWPIFLPELVPTSCIADFRQTWADAETHPEFLPYIERYLTIKNEITGKEEFDYPIKILFYRSDSETWRQVSRLARNFNFEVMGTFFDSRHIIVNKEIFLFHELGHADLDRDHEQEVVRSIMYTQRSSLHKLDLNEDPILRQELYRELFSKRGDFGSKYIEGQVYPTHLLNNDPNACSVQTRLYLDETNAAL